MKTTDWLLGEISAAMLKKQSLCTSSHLESDWCFTKHVIYTIQIQIIISTLWGPFGDLCNIVSLVGLHWGSVGLVVARCSV